MKPFLKKLTTHEGRRNRVEFLKGIGFLYLLMAIIVGIVIAFKDIPQFGILYFLVIPIAISGWFICIQRLHDCGQTGYWMLLKFVPVINLCLFLYLFFMPGNRYPNEYDFVKDGGMTKDLQ